MAITRDANYSEDIAQLFDALNRCADGYDPKTVLEASANMVVACVTKFSTGEADAMALTQQIALGICRGVEAFWQQSSQPSAIEVTEN